MPENPIKKPVKPAIATLTEHPTTSFERLENTISDEEIEKWFEEQE